MSALIGLMPEKRVGVYVLANLDNAELRHALMYEAFDMYNPPSDHPPRDWSADLKALYATKRAAGAASTAGRAVGDPANPKQAAASHPSLPLDRYAGAFTDSTYGTMQVMLAEGTLRARFVNFDIGQLDYAAYDTFRSRVAYPLEGITELTFVPDGAGYVSAVRALGVTFRRSGTGSGIE